MREKKQIPFGNDNKKNKSNNKKSKSDRKTKCARPNYSAVRLTVVLWVTEPEVPVTVIL